MNKAGRLGSVVVDASLWTYAQVKVPILSTVTAAERVSDGDSIVPGNGDEAVNVDCFGHTAGVEVLTRSWRG